MKFGAWHSLKYTTKCQSDVECFCKLRESQFTDMVISCDCYRMR